MTRLGITIATLVFFASVALESSALPSPRQVSPPIPRYSCTMFQSMRGGGLSKDDGAAEIAYRTHEDPLETGDKGPAPPPQQGAKRSLTFDSLPSFGRIPSFAASLLRHGSKQSHEYLPGQHTSVPPIPEIILFEKKHKQRSGANISVPWLNLSSCLDMHVCVHMNDKELTHTRFYFYKSVSIFV
jgi:hypothetical protein